MKGFSGRGERCTELERSLVNRPGTPEWTDGWVGLINTVGIDAIAAVMDWFGGEKIHVPTREAFFRALWREVRDAEIRRRIHVARERREVVAGDFGLAIRTIQRICKLGHGADDVARRRVVDGAP